MGENGNNIVVVKGRILAVEEKSKFEYKYDWDAHEWENIVSRMQTGHFVEKAKEKVEYDILKI
jgi:predicted NUDIX family phosphoesterase